MNIYEQFAAMRFVLGQHNIYRGSVTIKGVAYPYIYGQCNGAYFLKTEGSTVLSYDGPIKTGTIHDVFGKFHEFDVEYNRLTEDPLYRTNKKETQIDKTSISRHELNAFLFWTADQMQTTYYAIEDKNFLVSYGKCQNMFFVAYEYETESGIGTGLTTRLEAPRFIRIPLREDAGVVTISQHCEKEVTQIIEGNELLIPLFWNENPSGKKDSE
jgi:hypothetical protein